MLTQRSTEKEILDLGSDHYTEKEYKDCIKKLFIVNKCFGFYRTLKNALKMFPESKTLLDVGCGSGLCILNLSKVYPDLSMLGVDLSKDAINVAQQELDVWKERFPEARVNFKLLSTPDLQMLDQTFDIVTSTLVCHHLTDSELITFFQSLFTISNHVILLNDLHRHRISYYFYKMFSPLLFRNKLISHDGLISICRSFTKPELIALLESAGIQHYKITWCFPFRWSITIWKK